VTIPDDTVMQPGQSFTKVWRLQNVGTCTWTKSYAAAYFSGEQMGAAVSVPLAGNVAPGQSVDISVDMVAPTTPGKFQGNWKLRNASNVLFGIGPNGSAPFWARIVVANTPTGTTTVTKTPTPTSPAPANTPTATPVVRVSGSVNLSPTDTLDLDTTVINGGAGFDLLFEINGNGQHQLTPQNNAIIGVYGNSQPSKASCLSTPMTSLPIILENTPVVSYLCYRTDQGLPGYARLASFSVDSNAVTLDIVTWANP
jgi:Ig-like domain from next to BRCA1 gene